MTKELYVNLQEHITLYLPELKGKVLLWNNQFSHSNGTGTTGRDESAFQYPVVFLEFNDFQFRQLSLGIQEFDFVLTVRLGFKSFLKEDLDQLDLLERLYWVIQRFQKDSFARLSRISEEWDTNRTDVGITIVKYRGYGKDFNRFIFGNDVPVTPIDSVNIIPTVVNVPDVDIPINGSDANGRNTEPEI